MFEKLKSLKENFYYLQFIIKHFFRHAPILKKLIKGQKILIVGSGPSAAELDDIPEDIKIFTCHAGLRLFTGDRFNRKIDLFLTYKHAMSKHYEDIEEILPTVKIDLFLVDSFNYVNKKKELKRCYSSLIADRQKDNRYLKKLIKPYRIEQIIGNSNARHTSAGIALLQYALYFGAKEIYLIGIDFGIGGYFWGEKREERKHRDIDENFIKIVSKKYNNIYSLSKTSPITKYIPYGKL